MSHFPLNSAYLCETCGQVGDCSKRCAFCQSQSIIGLAGGLNRKSLSPEARAVLGYIPSWKGKVA